MHRNSSLGLRLGLGIHVCPLGGLEGDGQDTAAPSEIWHAPIASQKFKEKNHIGRYFILLILAIQTGHPLATRITGGRNVPIMIQRGQGSVEVEMGSIVRELQNVVNATSWRTACKRKFREGIVKTQIVKCRERE